MLGIFYSYVLIYEVFYLFHLCLLHPVGYCSIIYRIRGFHQGGVFIIEGFRKQPLYHIGMGYEVCLCKYLMVFIYDGRCNCFRDIPRYHSHVFCNERMVEREFRCTCVPYFLVLLQKRLLEK